MAPGLGAAVKLALPGVAGGVLTDRPQWWAVGGAAVLVALGAGAAAWGRRHGRRPGAVVAAVASGGAVLGLGVLSPWLAVAFFVGVLPGLVLVRLFGWAARPGPVELRVPVRTAGQAVLLLAAVELTVLGTAGQLAAAGRLPVGGFAAAAGWAALAVDALRAPGGSRVS
ncbi:hypothetical protein AB0O31_05905 [Kitasatospora cineracea]|uniref:hypothetical protein n=1 Tax=Kitasatospora cineracea TaxID=88074 RepID=UPI003435BEB6